MCQFVSTKDGYLRIPVMLVLAAIITACAVNPVTGQRELGLISEREEISMGIQHYGPSQQSQGGQFSTDPALNAYVSEVGQRIAAFSPRELPYEFVVLNSSVPNAWALPGGKIAINRGLLYELNSEAELAAVLGHEVIHSAARHGAQAMERGMLLQGALVATAIASSNSEYAGFILGGAQLGAQLITQRYGRDAERESDLYGTRYLAQAGYDPQAAVTLQQAFVRLSEGRNQGWLDGLFSSHPPSAERVENNRQLVQQLRAEGFTGGEQGVERYQQYTAFLRDTKPAYDAFDEAYALLRDDRVEAAEAKLDEALAMVPQEARFHGLKGDIALMQRRYNAAVGYYNQAISRDDNYFDYYLGRGLAYSRQGERALAQTDLQTSVNLLPTAVAVNELGTLALAFNEPARAKQYFQQAASAPGELGASALRAFQRLDINDNPASYVQASAYLDNNRRLMVRVTNAAALDVQQATLEVRAAAGDQGAVRRVNVQNLGAGDSRDYQTDLILPAELPMESLRVEISVQSVRLP